MKHITKFAALAASALCLVGCASTEYSMTPTGDAGGAVSYQSGQATVASEKDHSAVKVTPMGTNGYGMMKFGVAVLNRSSAPANIGTEDITLSDSLGSSLHVYTVAELTKAAQRRAATAEVLLALAGAAAAYGDSQSAYTTTYGNVGGTTYTATTYNPYLANDLAERDAANTGAAMSSVNASLNNVLANLNNSALQMTTVQPNNLFGGLVWAAPPKGLSEAKTPPVVTVTVEFAGDVHTFHFSLSKQ